MEDNDRVAFVACERIGEGPLDWQAAELVQYVSVLEMRDAHKQGLTKTAKPKGAQEGFEIQLTWPSTVGSTTGIATQVDSSVIKYRRDRDERTTTVQLRRKDAATLTPLVEVGQRIVPGQIIGSIVPVSTEWKCGQGARLDDYLDLTASRAITDRYAAVKALGRFRDRKATAALLDRVRDDREHVYIRVDAAAGLMRRGNAEGEELLEEILHDDYLQNRLEGAIVLGEVATDEAAAILIRTLEDGDQNPEIRAGAAWALGEVGTEVALPALVSSFESLATVVKIEAARALAKVARRHLNSVMRALPEGSEAQRPGIAWALSKAGGFDVRALLSALTDDDARRWVAYIVGTQNRETMLPDIEELSREDPEVYFAVTVLWKIMASWVYELDEY